MAKRSRLGNAGIYRATLMYLACTHVMLAAIRAMAASVSTLQTLARKRSKGRAPRIVAGGLDTTLSEDEQGTVLNETGAPLARVVSRRISSLTQSRRAPVALKDKQCTLSPASSAPPPAKVSPPLKLPVIDARLLISSSKVRPILSGSREVPLDIFFSLLALPGVGTIPP